MNILVYMYIILKLIQIFKNYFLENGTRKRCDGAKKNMDNIHTKEGRTQMMKKKTENRKQIQFEAY